MKGNIHKKVTLEDKFGRRYYCQNARLRQLRQEKKLQKRAFRNWRKRGIAENDL
jgi:hypothetical protein